MAKGNAVAKVDELDAVALLALTGIDVAEVLDAGQVIGEGFETIDKMQLVGVPFVIGEIKFAESKEFRNADGTGRGFVVLKVYTQEFMESNGAEGKWIVTDGSTGVYKQLGEWASANYTEADKLPPLLLKKGFIVSEYDKELPDGSVTHAKTFYIP